MNYLLNISDHLGVFCQIFTRPFQREQHDACLFSFYCVNKANFADRCGCLHFKVHSISVIDRLPNWYKNNEFSHVICIGR